MPPRNWWLRSPNVSNSNNVRNVNTSGSLNNNNASNTNGVSPDCVYSQFRVGSKEQKSEHHKQGTIIPFCGNRRIKSVDVIY